ncbi:hypothetical protein LCGC14_2020930 [marine sediment metagenome]|uniref:Uncharacterized protein n=1 Tax=marine sediment metagenome TaxID=412755 RepID=A0A0F9EXM6_9ZZZZ
MTNWIHRDNILRGILTRNNDPDNEQVSVANTKKELIPHFKFGKAVRFYKPDIILWLQTKHMVRPIEIDTRPTSKDHILREVQQGKEVV